MQPFRLFLNSIFILVIGTLLGAESSFALPICNIATGPCCASPGYGRSGCSLVEFSSNECPAADSRAKFTCTAPLNSQGTSLTNTQNTNASGNGLSSLQIAANNAVSPIAGPSVTPARVERDQFNSNDPRQMSRGGPCGMSATLGGGYNCDGTYSIVQGAQLSNMTSQTAGSMMTMSMGQSAQMTAMQSNSQAKTLEATAGVQENTGKMQMGLGGANAALGALQMYKYFSHNKNSRNVQGAYSEVNTGDQNKAGAKTESTGLMDSQSGYIRGGNGVGGQIVDKFQLNQNSGIQFTAVGNDPNTVVQQQADRKAQEEAHKREVVNKTNQVSNHISAEQESAASAAMGGGMMSMITGAQQLMSGSMSMASAKRLRETAASLNQTTGAALNPIAPPALPPSLTGASSFRAPAAITGSGATASSSEDAVADASGDAPDLGTGFNPNALPSGIPAGPAAGKFTEGTPQANMGGGGGGGMGGGNTAPASGQQEDPQAKLAPATQGTSYDGGGGSFMGGGGGGKGAEGGPDLSGLLEKFLPKKEDQERAGSSIMDFGGKAGSDEAPFSVLDRNTNIFQRVSETYRDKQSRGIVGI